MGPTWLYCRCGPAEGYFPRRRLHTQRNALEALFLAEARKATPKLAAGAVLIQDGGLGSVPWLDRPAVRDIFENPTWFRQALPSQLIVTELSRLSGDPVILSGVAIWCQQVGCRLRVIADGLDSDDPEFAPCWRSRIARVISQPPAVETTA